MLIARTRAELAAVVTALPGCALVPTMGALHAGHLALVTAARRDGPAIASIFVNPLQFGPGEDLSRYPRDEAADLAALRDAGCAAVFVPEVEAIYRAGDATTIEVGGPALGWEGERRPGHFRGVATVVARLFGLVRPRIAWFGEKDWQQLQVVRRMTADLCLAVEVRGLPTVRDLDGLALSSRNRYLSAEQRVLAGQLPRVLGLAAARAAATGRAAAAEGEAAEALARLGFEVDYLAVVDPHSLAAMPVLDRPARLIAAARLGPVRLLDNLAIGAGRAGADPRVARP